MATSIKEAKITSKGQITLPMEWRKEMGYLSHVQIQNNDGTLVIKPSYDHEGSWGESIDFRQFDPKGVPIGDVLAALQTLEKHDG